MKFLLDQSAEERIGTFLSSLGHDAKRVGRDYPPGLPDEQVLEISNTEQRILIANDRDFGELIFRQKMPHSGVIYFRFPLDSTSDQKISSLYVLLSSHQHQVDRFLVVTPRGVRVR